MQLDSIIQKWLDHNSKKNKYEKQKSIEHIQLFFQFINKSPKHILNENKVLSNREFKKDHSKHLSSFIAYLKKQNLEPNSIREIVEIIQKFYKFYNLPLSLGFKGHIDLFLK